MISILLVLSLLAPSPVERDSQELQQIQEDLRRQQQQISAILALLEQSRTDQKSTCSADLRLIRGTEQYAVPASQAAVVPINLLSLVSQPGAFCLPTEIRVVASYLGPADALICSGAIEQVAAQSRLSQNVNLQLRPWNMKEFVLWLNEPPGDTAIAKRLACVTPDGLNEIEVDSLESVVAVKVQLTALPRGGGMSTVEIRFSRPGSTVR